MDEVVKYLKALVFLQVNSITGEVAGKPEVLLYRAGLSVKEISGILGKSEAAIAKSLTRFKAGKSKEATSG